MADFCKQCSVENFGEDSEDLAKISKPEDTMNKMYLVALCEGCAGLVFDHNGCCVDEHCLKKHGLLVKIL